MTRDEAVDYYRRVAKFILPHLRNRPVSFKRFPGDSEGEFYWEKDAPSFTPHWVRTIAVPRRSGESDIEYIVINDAKTLTWVASAGGIEIHPFLHRWPKIDVPTEIVFDLDPGPGAGILDCCRVAVILRDALDVPSFVKVSGSKGLQVYVPARGGLTHERTEDFAHTLAGELARKHPKLIVSKMAKHLRAKKVFIDWSQNADYKTTIGVYSLRATGFVSMPMTWSEIEKAKEVAKLHFTPEGGAETAGPDRRPLEAPRADQRAIATAHRTPKTGCPPEARLAERAPPLSPGPDGAGERAVDRPARKVPPMDPAPRSPGRSEPDRHAGRAVPDRARVRAR